MIYMDKETGNLIYKVRDLDKERGVFMEYVKNGEFIKNYKDLIKID